MVANQSNINQSNFGTIVAIAFNPAGATELAGTLMIMFFARSAEIAD